MATKEQIETHMMGIDHALGKAVVKFQKHHGGAMPHESAARFVALNDLTEKQVKDQEIWAEMRNRLKLTQSFSTTSEASLSGEGVTQRTPFDEIAEIEERNSLAPEQEARIFMEAAAWLIGFMFHDGPHPAHVMRRLYSWVKKFHPNLIWDMGFRNLAKLLGESHAAMQWRIEQLIDEYMRAKGLNGVKVPWQRSSAACEKYAENSKGNSNRVGGKRSAKHKSKIHERPTNRKRKTT